MRRLLSNLERHISIRRDEIELYLRQIDQLNDRMNHFDQMISRTEVSLIHAVSGVGDMKRGDGKRFAVVIVVLFCVTCACSSYQAEKHYKKGVEYQKSGECNKALEEYSCSLQCDPQRIDARLGKASVYETQALWNEAVSAI